MIDEHEPYPWSSVRCRYCGADEIVRDFVPPTLAFPFVCMECGAHLTAAEVGYETDGSPVAGTADPTG